MPPPCTFGAINSNLRASAHRLDDWKKLGRIADGNFADLQTSSCGFPSLDRCPLAEGEITDIADGTMFIGLQRYQQQYGSPYKLCFGPKSFLVVSDPV